MQRAAEPGAIVWRERRTRPVVALFGVPTVFLAISAVAASPPLLQVAAAVGAVAFAVLGVRAWPRAVIETYSVSDRAVTLERPNEPAVSVPLTSVERATMIGDRVQFDTSEGELTLGFVRRQRSLMRALERVAPTVVVDRKLDAFCRT